jgi:uncharacterized protein (DUF1684 family)
MYKNTQNRENERKKNLKNDIEENEEVERCKEEERKKRLYTKECQTETTYTHVFFIDACRSKKKGCSCVPLDFNITHSVVLHIIV